MTDSVCATVLSRTYYHRISAWRPTDMGETLLCSGEKCALSRLARVSAPTPSDSTSVLPEASYRLSLYTMPDRIFRLGDRVEITDTAGRVFHGWTSDSVCYPSHCITVVEIREVADP